MKISRLAWMGAVAALCLASPASPEAAKTKAGSATMTAAGDLKWVDVPGFPVKTATTWGDAAKGAHGAFHKFPAGFDAPLHHHTADHHVVVVAGTVTLTPEGEAAKTLGPGSYFAFTGMKKHGTKCEPGADCVLYAEAAAAWDVIVAEPAKK